MKDYFTDKTLMLCTMRTSCSRLPIDESIVPEINGLLFINKNIDAKDEAILCPIFVCRESVLRLS